MILTPKNYFTSKNTAISNSKVGDFLKSKEYFYKRHISHELDFKQTAPMIIGTMVDCLVSGEPIPYEVKVLKKNDEALYEEQKELPPESFCTEAELNEAVCRAHAITREPFYKWYKDNGAKFQVILQQKSKADGPELCGIADVITETEDTIYIDDFKASSAAKVRSPKHWHWNCLDMGYYRQLGAYSGMFRHIHPENTKPIVCRHVVVAKMSQNIYKVFLFILPAEELERGWKEFFETALAIHTCKDFSDPEVTWDKAISLENVFEPAQEEEEEDLLEEELRYEYFTGEYDE